MIYLASKLETAISVSLDGRKSDREDFWLWALFKDGLPSMAEVLSEAFGRRTALAGVWCHSTPKVEFHRDGRSISPSDKAGPSCEIGDLLLVTSQLVDSGPPINRSILMQLKRKAKPDSKSSDQNFLYEDWPQFRYKLKPQETRHVTAGLHRSGKHPGAQFGVLFEKNEGRGLEKSTMAVTNESDFSTLEITGGSLNHKLSLHIAQQLAGVVGAGLPFKPFGEIDSDETEWSRVVWDLLEQSFVRAKEFRIDRKRRGSRTWPETFFRSGPEPEILLESGAIHSAVQQLWNQPSFDGDDGEFSPSDDDVPGDGPIPIIFAQLDSQTQTLDD